MTKLTPLDTRTARNQPEDVLLLVAQSLAVIVLCHRQQKAQAIKVIMWYQQVPQQMPPDSPSSSSINTLLVAQCTLLLAPGNAGAGDGNTRRSRVLQAWYMYIIYAHEPWYMYMYMYMIYAHELWYDICT